MASWVWSALVLPAALAAAWLVPGTDRRAALASGAFLATLDLAVENVGGMLELWTTRGSVLAIGATPIEVVVIAFLAGAALGPGLERWPWSRAVAVVALAAGGVGIEAGLQLLGLITYRPPWNAALALLAYVAALSATAALHAWLTAPTAEAGRVSG